MKRDFSRFSLGSSFSEAEGDGEDGRQVQRDGGAGGTAQVVGGDQARDAGKQGGRDGKDMVLPHIFRDISRTGGRENQEGIDDHQAYPGNGQGHDDRDNHGEDGLTSSDIDAPGGCQLGMGRQQHQPVAGQAPENEDAQQHQGQDPDL